MPLKDIYVYKQQKLYAKVQQGQYYLLKDNSFYLANEQIGEILDILPEGIDLKIMLKSFNVDSALELLPYLRNTIGEFDSSYSSTKTNFDKPNLSNLDTKESIFPNILDVSLNIPPTLLYSVEHSNPNLNKTQHLSLSGYQHKIQVNIINNVINDSYGDFILKPYNDNYPQLPYNEHLNVSFMKEFGFNVPFNALIYDNEIKLLHYIIKRFDIDSNGNKLPQVSLNTLMKSNDKYDSSIEEISNFLRDRLDSTQKIQFLKYIYANALLHNNDLHKKNISFVFKDNKLHLSPVYDVINIYAVKGLDNKQCVLSINNHTDNIKISYFKESSTNLGLDFNEVKKI